MSDRLLTVEDVAEWAQLEPPAVRREIRQGRLKAARIAGKYRISVEQRDQWFAERIVICDADDSAVSLRGAPAAAKTAFRQVSDSMGRRRGRPALTDVSAQGGR